MQSLYTEKNLADLKNQIRKRRLIFFALLAAAAGLIVWTLLLDNHRENRPVVLTTLILVASGCGLIFFYDLLIHPLRAYERHLISSLHGRFHEVTVVFDHLNEEETMIDGLTYRDLIFLGEPDKHGDRERLFYWDAEIPLPSFASGQEVTLQYFDRFITAYRF